MPVRYNRSSLLHDQPETRSTRERIGAFGHRIARVLLGPAEDQQETMSSELGRWLRDERGAVGEEVLPRYPMARRGYECTAVDEHVSELERELAQLEHEAVELRARATSREDVADELKRIGEQTSGVLIAAHEQREEMLRSARADADRCVVDAQARSLAIMTEAQARVRELEAQRDAVHRERDRLLEDAHQVSTALAALTQSAQQRIPPLT